MQKLLGSLSFVVTLLACNHPEKKAGAIAPGSGPLDPMPVVVADGTNHLTANVLGVVSNPMAVTVVSGSGGSADAGVPSVDPIGAAISLDQAVIQNTPATANVLIDGGSHYFIAATVHNYGTTAADWQLYAGQTVPDAGGTAASATVPTLDIQCPAGTTCGLPATYSPVLISSGGVWYSSADAGYLVSSTSAFTVQLASIR
jgi:hypothetical protein